ncbi:MAG: hypothetical protein JST27_08580 [Bacteroidetes bacterium]|nr:hypothetical protein [Bacteroidota bacterium]
MENYKLTKAIRFRLEPTEENNLIQQQVDELKNISFDLVSFISKLGNFKDSLKQYLLHDHRNGTKQVKSGLSIKSEWLKRYAKQIFHDSEAERDKTKRKQTKTIGEFGSLAKDIEDRLDELENTYQELTDDAIAQLNERARNAHSGLLLKRLGSRNGLSYFVDLVENSVDKHEEGDLSIQLKSQGKALHLELLAGIKKFLPEQSTGVPIAKASFNYYTINKMPVDYAQKVREQQSKLLITDWNGQIWSGKSYSREIKDDVQAGGSDLEALRQKLKNIKAQQKARFNELMTQNLSFQELKNNAELYLFSSISEQEFNSYKDLTGIIEKEATKLSQASDDSQKLQLRSNLQRLKKERGALINAADKRNQNSFKTYKGFADLYRNIALKHGRILSTIKGIEKEAVESQLLQYWSLVLEREGRHQLLLIPKQFAAKCYAFVCNAPVCQQTSASKIYWLESFTLRSLRKLCFGHLDAGTNTFNNDIQSVLRYHSYSETDNRGQNKQVNIEGEFSFKGDARKIIAFYKDVLASRYTQPVLKLPIRALRKEVTEKNFETLDEFQIALEKICYKRYALLPEQILDTIIRRYQPQVFDITSTDLTKGESDNEKRHTQIWRRFWTNENEQQNFDIRINPELAILWRPAKESRVHKYGKESALFDENKHNRYLHPQFTLVTTISEHSNTPTKELSFMTDEEFTHSVEEFNNKFKKEDFKFALGIDNGETELATFGVYFPVFKQNTHEESIQEIDKINEYGFKVLSITNLSHSEADKNGKDRKIIQNPSYFLSKEQYTRTFEKTETEYQTMFSKLFKEDSLLTLDLTTAKVIGGHIITNGDVPTYFNLWMRHAQRMLWDMNDHAEKQTAKQITLKKSEDLNQAEKEKFIEYLNLTKNNKKYFSLSETEKTEYTNWIYAIWNRQTTNLPAEKNQKYETVKKDQRVGYYSKHIILAVCYIGEDLQSVTEIFDVRNIFKLRKDFFAIKTEQEIIQELNNYNTNENRQQIGNEELELKINHLRAAVVANAIGVIDSLYHYYKSKTQGEGLVIKEGFDTNKVAEDLGKFSGNIYRVLERKLYQKFQNYGLVPPIKSLMTVRSEGLAGENNKDAIIRLGNICFISDFQTSNLCPSCGRNNPGHIDPYICNNCNFNSSGLMHSNDGVAGYNIAKRGFYNFLNPAPHIIKEVKKSSEQPHKNTNNNRPQNNNKLSQHKTDLEIALEKAGFKNKR